MAGTGGYRPGAGRPKGSVNSQSVKLQERALASGYAPLDVLLGMMRWYYEKAERLLRPTTSALQAVEKVFAQGYDTHPATFVRALADLGFIIVDKDAKPEDAEKLEAKIDRLYDKAGEHAARAAPFIHPKMSPMDLNSRFDMMRLTYDERRDLGRLLSKGLGLGEPEVGSGLQLEHDEREPTV
jgi:hypothetical protein